MKHNRILSFLMLFLLLGNLFLGLSFTVTAPAPTMTTNDATGIGSTNATLQGTLTDDGSEQCDIAGFDYGTTTGYGSTWTSDNSYVYAGGVDVGKIYKYWKTNMTKAAESAKYGGSDPTGNSILMIIQDADYLYAGGVSTISGVQNVRQYWKSNLTTKAQTLAYGGAIEALAQDDIYVYVGGGSPQKIKQYWKSNMSLKAESADYGATILGLAVDDTYVYVGGNANVVKQYWKSNLTYKAETASYGNVIMDIATDSTYLYVAGRVTGKVYQYWLSNLTKKAETVYYNTWLEVMTLDDNYVYASGVGNVTQYWKSNMTKKAESASVGGYAGGIADDETYVYRGGSTNIVHQYLKSNMTLKTQSADYGGDVYGISTSDSYLTGDTFSYDWIGLTPGQLYHFRAYATNSIGRTNGSDREFLTKPIEPASLTATANTTNISLTWTKGIGANNTYIERNTVSSWARGAGTLVYNTTGTSCKNSGLAPGTLYYYRAWSFAKWNTSQQWSDINISSYALTKPEAPTNTNLKIVSVSVVNFIVNLTWTKGTGANNTVVLMKTTGGTPTSITDGTVIYNSTGTYKVQTLLMGTTYFFRAWGYTSWITPALYQYSVNSSAFTNSTGGLFINCYDVNTHANLTFNVTISNPAGTQVYVNASCINTLQINATLCPQGIGIQVIVSAIGYKQSVYVLDIYPSIFYLLNTYLILATPTGTPSGNETSALYYLRVVETIQTTYTQVDQAVEDALVTVKRYINATGVYETISSLYTDANGYVNLYLAPNGYYKVFINKSGYYDKISDYIPAPPNAFGQTVEKVFRILLIAANVTPPPSYLWSDYITFIGSMNNATSIIYVNYTDALTNTTDWQLFIYRIDPNSTTPTLVKSWSGTNDTFALSKNVTDSTDDYKVVFHVNHTNFGYQVRELYFFGYHAKLTSAAKFNLLFTLNYGYNPFGWANTFMFFVILGCFFSFGRRETYMAVFAIGILLLFMNFYIGIETVWSALAGGAFPIILIFFGILMLVRDRTFSGAS